MATSLAPFFRQRYFNSNGAPLAGGKLYTYQSGTSTPQVTYTDATGFSQNSNPVILDANGEASVWLDQSLSYKVTLKDSLDVQQWFVDSVAASSGAATSIGGGSKNYFQLSAANPGFESASIGPWSSFTTVYSNGVPTTVNLTSSQTTFTTTTLNPLTGTNNGRFTKSAANAQGQGFISGVITIDREDFAKVLYGSFAHESVSGTIDFSGGSTQSLEIWVYNVTAGTWIQPFGYRGMNQGVGPGKVSFGFQTDGTPANNQYRIAIILAQTDANAMAINFDDFQLGPSSIVQGFAGSDWQIYAPTYTGFGTVTGSSMFWRRVGDSIEIKGTFVSGTISAVTAQVSLPNSWVIDPVKTPATRPSGTYLGVNGTGRNTHGGELLAVSSAQSIQFGDLGTFGSGSIGTSMTTPQTGTAIAVSGDVMTIEGFTVGISGWSSNTQFSNDTDTRVVAAQATGAPANVSSGNPIVVPTIQNDTHAAYSVVTGRYTVPVSGFYRISGACNASGVGAPILIYVYLNAVQKLQMGAYNTTGVFSGSVTIKANAGDIIDMRPVGTGIISFGDASIAIERLSGPSVIAATETVSARYSGIPTGTIGATFAGATSITFPTKTYSSHGVYDGTSFVTPISGKYRFSGQVGIAATFSAGQFALVALAVNGTEMADYSIQAGGGSGLLYASIIDEYPLNAGDVVTFRAVTNGTTPTFGSSSPNYRMAITRVGN